MTILITNELDFSGKKITRDREGYYIMKKGSVHQKGTAINTTSNPQGLLAHETINNIDRFLGHQTNLIEFKIYEIIECVFDNNGIKL